MQRKMTDTENPTPVGSIRRVGAVCVSRLWLAITLSLSFLVGVNTCLARAEGDLTRKATWNEPTADAVKSQIEQWLTSINATPEQRQKAMAGWLATSELGDEPLLDRTAAALVGADTRATEVLNACQGDGSDAPATFRWLFEEATPEFVRHNLRLLYGRWLVRHAHYDEAVAQLEGLTPQQVVDPAALLFYRSVAHHRLLQKDQCLRSLATLLENEVHLPRRYRLVAKLMEADIRPLEADSLDEVARLMDDVRRRLNMGHAGKRVRKEEDDVIAKLDKMIDEMEQQQQKQQSSSQSQGGAQSSNPAQDSAPLGGTGPGDVHQKKIGTKSGWGNLPAKQREEALQQISKDLPAHYREVIEEYFRKLAREGGR